jgi:hypothetical protein
MEPAWTKGIEKRTICTFYYALFILNCVIAALMVAGLVGTIAASKKLSSPVFWLFILVQIGLLSIGVLNALFLYVICERALVDEKKNA